MKRRQSSLVLPGRVFRPCARPHSSLDTLPSHPEAAFSREGRGRPLGSALAKWGRRCLQVTPSLEGRLLSLWGPGRMYIPTLMASAGAPLGISWGPTRLHSPQEGMSGSVTGLRVSRRSPPSPLQPSHTPSLLCRVAFQPSTPLLGAATPQLPAHSPHSLRPPSQLPVSPSTPAPASFGVSSVSLRQAHSSGQPPGLGHAHPPAFHPRLPLGTHTLGWPPAALSPPVPRLRVTRPAALLPCPAGPACQTT